MKIRLTVFLLAVTFLTAGSVSAQTSREIIRADLAKASHVFNMYPKRVPVPAARPEGYKPFYISHYGRHGARNNSSDEEYLVLRNMLEEAYANDNLTRAGEQLRERFLPAFEALYLRGGDLSSKGKWQHHDIACRMYLHYPEVFRSKDRYVDARSTTVPRCIQSMAAFCSSLREGYPGLKITQTCGRWLVNPLNPFTTANPDCTATDEGWDNKYAAWQESYRAYRKELLHPDVFFGHLFKDPSFVSRYAPKGLHVLEEDLISMSGTMQCSDVDITLSDLYPFEEVYNNYLLINYKYFVSKGPDNEIQGGRQWTFVTPFFDDLISLADEDISSGKVAARLRFGHDITLMSMLVFLDVEGWNRSARTPWEVAEVWNSYNVPMAANIQFIFYRNRGGDILVRAMYNEKDLRFPIESPYAPYYRWEDFKAFCAQRRVLARHILETTQAPRKR